MTDLSGIGSNLTFTNGVPPKAPYYYITAHLDLSGAKVVDQEGTLTYYFNRDNNLNYLNSQSEGYYGFYQIDSNAVIGDVVLYSNPDFVENVPRGYEVGGAELDPLVLDPELAQPVQVLWGGPTGFTSGPVSAADINTGVVCFYGHEGGHEPQDLQAVNENRYLAVSITTSPPVDEPILIQEAQEELIVINEEVVNQEQSDLGILESAYQEQFDLGLLESARSAKRNAQDLAKAIVHGKVVKPEDSHNILEQLRGQKKQAKARAPRVVVDPDIISGTLYVVVKVYPKQTS